jgi:cytoskeletal protein RodZ
MPSLGENFKAAREAKNLTLEQVAQETRISTRFLRAIEEEAFHSLPGGVFNRGFIRTFSERVGLDADQMLSAYAVLTADNGLHDVEGIQNAPAPPTTERHVLPIAVAALVAVVGLYYVFAPAANNTAPPSEDPAATARSESAPPPAPDVRAVAPSTPGGMGGTDLEHEMPATGREDGAVTGNGANSMPAEEPASASSAAATDAMPTEPEDALADNPTGTGVANRVVVELQVIEATWIAVESDGESIIVGETLEPGVNRSFSANDALDLTVGNAAGIALSINGEPVPDLGNPGQVRQLNITPENYRRLTGP